MTSLNVSFLFKKANPDLFLEFIFVFRLYNKLENYFDKTRDPNCSVRWSSRLGWWPLDQHYLGPNWWYFWLENIWDYFGCCHFHIGNTWNSEKNFIGIILRSWDWVKKLSYLAILNNHLSGLPNSRYQAICFHWTQAELIEPVKVDGFEALARFISFTLWAMTSSRMTLTERYINK